METIFTNKVAALRNLFNKTKVPKETKICTLLGFQHTTIPDKSQNLYTGETVTMVTQIEMSANNLNVTFGH